MDEKQKIANFLHVKEVADKHKVPLILCQGVLLGAIRENRLLPWDGDFDFFILSSIPYKNIVAMIDQFSEEGSNIWETYNIPDGTPIHWSFAHSPASGKSTFGFKILYPSKDPNFFCAVTCYLGRDAGAAMTLFPKDMFDPPQEFEFLGKTFLVPKPPEKWIEMNFGANWKTKVLGYSWMKNKQWKIALVNKMPESPWPYATRIDGQTRLDWLKRGRKW